MLLSCSNLSKSFLEKNIIKNASFHLEENDKAAITGINGAGKTTLLKMITGELPPDDGVIAFSKNATFGYLSQQHNVDNNNSIWDELKSVKENVFIMRDKLSQMETEMKELTGDALGKLMEQYTTLSHQYELINGYACESEINGILKGLGFLDNDFAKLISTLSGGQKTRVALAKILLMKPDLIILDEPTNHLDIQSIQYLESFIRAFKGCVLLVSHDRYFLDRTVNKIIEIDNCKVTVFTGNYSEYAKKRESLRIAAWNAYANQQQMIKHQEAVIEKLRSFNREKSIKRAESREKMLDKIEVLEKPVTFTNKMNITLTPHLLSGNDVLSIKDLSKSFGEKTLFSNANIEIKRAEHVALIGNNGTGKTTLFKIINQLLDADSGIVKLGANVVIGYYDQEHQLLNGENTLFEEISDAYPNLTNTQIRNTLAAFLFTNDDVFKRVDSLSGGEKGRLCLAKLMLSECNFLILDEPTNHLDIESKEILESALNNYEGTCFYISHDRYFVNKTAHRILELSDNTFCEYLGNYDYYLEKKEAKQVANIASKESSSKAELTESAKDYKAMKEIQAAKRKKENEIKKLEDKISDYENQISELDTIMSLPENATNSARLHELSDKQAALMEELDAMYEKWEELQE